MSYLFDTNVCIELLRGDSPQLRATMLSHQPSQIEIPAIVEAELLHGALKSLRVAENLRAVKAFLNQFAIVPFDSAAAAHYAATRRTLEQAGQIIGPLDLLIAATALAVDGILVTHNTTEFSRFPALRVEDWQ